MDDVYEGQRVLIEVEIRRLGVPTDPTVLTLTARAPSGTTTVYVYPADDFTRRDLGLFEGAVLVSEPGLWAFRADASGVVDAVDEYKLMVLPSSVN